MSNLKVLLLVLMSVILLSACGNSSATPNGGGDSDAAKGGTAEPKNQEPVKLVLWDNFAADPDEYINTMYVEPVKKKYPNITVEVITGKDRKIEDMVVNGDQVDIVVDNVIRTNRIEELGLNYDLSELIKKNNFDLKRLEKPTLDMIRSFNSTKKLIGLPTKGGFMALYYNKDLFDKFGVPYPKDDITWDQTVDLAKKLSRTQDGANYYALDSPLPEIASSLTANYIDAKTGKANLSTPEWRQGFEVFQRLNAIPGNQKDAKSNFMKTQNVAMSLSQNILLNLEQLPPEFNWDMVTYPKFQGKPIAGSGSARAMYITSTSKHKDDAFKVIEALDSDEMQVAMAQSCGMPEVKTETTKKNFCAQKDFAKGKNLQAAFKFSPMWPVNPTEYDAMAKSTLNKHAKDLETGAADINTVIREAEEEINQKIAELKSQ